MSCEDCLSRRAFLAKGTLVVASVALVAGCGDGQFGSESATAPTDKITVKVSTIPALATVGQLVRIPPERAFIVVKRTTATTFLAFTSICSHEGTATNLIGNLLDCPNHRAQFDSNGTVTRQPNNGGRATNLQVYASFYDPATDILSIG